MKAFHYCQHCGSLSLPKDVKITGRQREILELMWRRPVINKAQLLAALSMRIDTLNVHISNLNLEINRHGIALRADREGFYRFHRLIVEAAE